MYTLSNRGSMKERYGYRAYMMLLGAVLFLGHELKSQEQTDTFPEIIVSSSVNHTRRISFLSIYYDELAKTKPFLNEERWLNGHNVAIRELLNCSPVLQDRMEAARRQLSYVDLTHMNDKELYILFCMKYIDGITFKNLQPTDLMYLDGAICKLELDVECYFGFNEAEVRAFAQQFERSWNNAWRMYDESIEFGPEHINRSFPLHRERNGDRNSCAIERGLLIPYNRIPVLNLLNPQE